MGEHAGPYKIYNWSAWGTRHRWSTRRGQCLWFACWQRPWFQNILYAWTRFHHEAPCPTSRRPVKSTLLVTCQRSWPECTAKFRHRQPGLKVTVWRQRYRQAHLEGAPTYTTTDRQSGLYDGEERWWWFDWTTPTMMQQGLSAHLD